jgi:hypothetical protein
MAGLLAEQRSREVSPSGRSMQGPAAAPAAGGPISVLSDEQAAEEDQAEVSCHISTIPLCTRQSLKDLHPCCVAPV